jgi:hypothetical protein
MKFGQASHLIGGLYVFGDLTSKLNLSVWQAPRVDLQACGGLSADSLTSRAKAFTVPTSTHLSTILLPYGNLWKFCR